MVLTKTRELLTDERALLGSMVVRAGQISLLGCKQGEMGSRTEKRDFKLNYELTLQIRHA